MKKFLLLFLTFISLNVIAQNDYFKIKEGSFKHISMAVWDDNKEDHRDIDNNPMSLFKISTENINDEQRRKLYFTGNRVTEALLYNDDYNGYYWSSTPSEDNSKYAYYLVFDDDFKNVTSFYREDGKSVRPVSE